MIVESFGTEYYIATRDGCLLWRRCDSRTKAFHMLCTEFKLVDGYVEENFDNITCDECRKRMKHCGPDFKFAFALIRNGLHEDAEAEE